MAKNGLDNPGFFGPPEDRWKTAPRGGEFNYYSAHDQRQALATTGPHGIGWESAAAAYHMSYILGNDQSGYRSAARITSASLAAGYRFTILSAASEGKSTLVVIRNDGVAPLYYDAWPSLGGTRSRSSLKGLLPGESRGFDIPAAPSPGLNDITSLFYIACDRLVKGQKIQFAADLGGNR